MKDYVANNSFSKAEEDALLADFVLPDPKRIETEQANSKPSLNDTIPLKDIELDGFFKTIAPYDEEAEHASLLAELNMIGSSPLEPETTVKAEAGPAGPIPVEDVVGVKPHVELANVMSNSVETLIAPNQPQPVPVRLQNTSLPDGYAIFAEGVYETPVDENAEMILICTPIRVEAIFSDQQGRGYGRLVSVKSVDEKWHEISIMNADLQRRPNDVIATLADHGFELAADKKSKDRLLALLKAWKPAAHITTVPHMGWADGYYTSFVLGKKVIGRTGILPPAVASGIGKGLCASGSVDEWKEHIGKICIGNPLMILAVSLAFSGPLLAPLGLHGGGLHFRGASSSGKTTLLNLSASVWGDRQLISQWRATSNGLEAIAATMNDMLLPLDEIAEITARNLHEVIYMLANGTGKARMTKDVTLADQVRWRLALISSGEISVEEKLKEGRLSSMAGHEVRLIDVEADSRTYGAFDNIHNAKNAATFAEQIQQAARRHHGAVGHAFVYSLIEKSSKSRLEDLKKMVDEQVSIWLAKLPGAADGQISRIAQRFALIGVAGDLATKFDLTGWKPNDASAAAEHAFSDWYDRRYGLKREAADGFVKILKDFLQADASKLHNLGSASAVSEDAMGWHDTSLTYIPPATWAQLFTTAEGTKAATALVDVGMLLSGEEGRHKRKAPRTIPGRPRLYTLNTERVMAYKGD